jgi:hypothetical protein
MCNSVVGGRSWADCSKGRKRWDTGSLAHRRRVRLGRAKHRLIRHSPWREKPRLRSLPKSGKSRLSSSRSVSPSQKKIRPAQDRWSSIGNSAESLVLDPQLPRHAWHSSRILCCVSMVKTDPHFPFPGRHQSWKAIMNHPKGRPSSPGLAIH